MSDLLAGGSGSGEGEEKARLNKLARRDDDYHHDKGASYWWDFGIVSATSNVDAKLSLLKVEGNEIQPCAASIEFNRFRGMGFALVGGSKLYAFGRCHDDDEGLDYFVCNLKSPSYSSSSSGHRDSYQFKPEGRLLGPKPHPIVIPYQNKIYLIPTGSSGYGINTVPLFAEVLRLPSPDSDLQPSSDVLKTPFDEDYNLCKGIFPKTKCFTVSGKYAFIHMSYKSLYDPLLFCLNMDTGKWIPYCFTGTTDNSCYESINDDSSFEFVRCVLLRMPSTPLNKICQGRGKIFVLKHVLEEDGSKYPGKFHVGITDISVESKVRYQVQPLESLSKYLNQHLKDMRAFRKDWTLPLDVGKNWFCIFVLYKEKDVDKGCIQKLFACKFELFEKSRPEDVFGMDVDDDDAANSRYDCMNLSHAVYKDICEVDGSAYAFTPAGSCTFTIPVNR